MVMAKNEKKKNSKKTFLTNKPIFNIRGHNNVPQEAMPRVFKNFKILRLSIFSLSA